MSAAWQYYLITLLIYLGVNTMACWSLNLQYGYAGIMNFAFIIFQAAGAYAAAVTTMGSPTPGSYQQYIGGAHLPWPLPLVVGGAVGAGLAWVIGLFAFRPARRDYHGMVLLVSAIIVTTLVSTQSGWFNGETGLAGNPKPLQQTLGLGLVGYGWFYVGLTAVVVGLCGLVVYRLTSSPWGRRVRALRESQAASEALGCDTKQLLRVVFMIGGAIAGVSGAVLVQFLGAWSPSAWGSGETFIYFCAVIVGGLGNNFGAFIGSAIVLTVVIEGVQYLPAFSNSNVSEALQLIVLAAVVLLFLWFRPEGLVRERRRLVRADSKFAIGGRGAWAADEAER